MGHTISSGTALAEKNPALAESVGECVVCAPVSGSLLSLSRLKDPVFSQGMLGPGFALRPEGGVALSPVSGTVACVARTGHALLVRTAGGAEVLLHVGMDTVRLCGEGFRPLVGQGSEVRAGEPVLAFDRALLRARGLDDTVIVTVSNASELAGVRVLRATGRAAAGEALAMAGC